MNDNHKRDARDESERTAAEAAMRAPLGAEHPLVTAYALGELEGASHSAERAQVETLLARDDRAREEVERIREMADELQRDLAVEGRGPAPALSVEQRRAIELELATGAASDEAEGDETAAAPAAAPRLRRLPLWMAAAASLVGVALIVWALRPGERAATPTAGGPTDLVAMNEKDEFPTEIQDRLAQPAGGEDKAAAATAAASPTEDSAAAIQLGHAGNAAAGEPAKPTTASTPDGTVIFTDGPTRWLRADEYIAREGGQSGSAAPAEAPAAKSLGAQYKAPPDAGAAESLQALGYINTEPPTNPTGSNAPGTGASHLTARKARAAGLAAAAPVAPNEPVILPETAPDDHDDRRQPEPCIYWRVQPTPGTEYYAPIVEQGFASPIREPLSTFSIDVDTASYANVRRFLNNGQLPPPDAVRIEELVNYFAYDYPAPEGDDAFATHVAVTECPWAAQHRLVRIGIKGKVVPAAQRAASNLVFLLDVSGSMNEPDKLPLLVASMKLLVGQLDERDRVAIVTYAGNAGLRLESTTCDPAGRSKALGVLDSLAAGGSTAGAAGIQLAYQIATGTFIKGGTNRVILATDGDFNVGITDRESLQRLIEDAAKSGVFLSVLGFGEGNLKDGTAELLADKGNGNYSYIDSLDEGRRVLVKEMGGTLVTIAKDVKIQVEFNPAKVAAYRLIGYENRALAAQDFNDDRKDAGEIGAGHTITALYEVVPVGAAVVPGVDPLKYQVPADLPKPQLTDSPDLLTVSLRWKKPDADVSSKLSMPVADQGGTLAQAGPDASFAAAVAAFGMLLRGSASAGDASWDSVIALAEQGRGADKDGYRAEFIRLVQVAKGLSGR